MHWLCLKNERFNVSLRRISLIHKSTYVFVEFVILHSYNKKYANIFDHFKFKRDFFFFCEISVIRGSANISDLGIHCHQKAWFRSYCARSCYNLITRGNALSHSYDRLKIQHINRFSNSYLMFTSIRNDWEKIILLLCLGLILRVSWRISK